jgi:hypothetical protein
MFNPAGFSAVVELTHAGSAKAAHFNRVQCAHFNSPSTAFRTGFSVLVAHNHFCDNHFDYL